jgi:hypothetical protein
MLSRQPCEPIKVLVAEPCMPAPCILRGVRRKAHRFDELKADNVEAILCMQNSGKDVLPPVAHGHETVLDKGWPPNLVELADGDDVALEPWDPVYLRQRAVFVSRDGEQNRPTSMDRHE